MKQYFNNLSPGELERLAILAEECSEVIKVIGKIFRHGWAPFKKGVQYNNRLELSKELGHVQQAIEMLIVGSDINPMDIINSQKNKKEEIKDYLHHQD